MSMRRMAYSLVLAGLFGFAIGGSSPAFAQGPPLIPNTSERSGVITRYSPIVPRLPRDADRDDYYITRWAEPDVEHPNVHGGGLYGLKWNSDCVACQPGVFRGFPGRSCVDGKCYAAPKSHRIWDNFVHPWRPVGFYYSGGCSVPVYDLDPLVTGPGPFPWPVFFKRPTGG